MTSVVNSVASTANVTNLPRIVSRRSVRSDRVVFSQIFTGVNIHLRSVDDNRRPLEQAAQRLERRCPGSRDARHRLGPKGASHQNTTVWMECGRELIATMVEPTTRLYCPTCDVGFITTTTTFPSGFTKPVVSSMLRLGAAR